jgi:hypothetical protein
MGLPRPYLRPLGELAQIPGVDSPKGIKQAIAMPETNALESTTLWDFATVAGSELDDMAQGPSARLLREAT